LTQANLDLAPRKRICRGDLACVVIIALSVALMGGRGITQGGLGWSDAPNHVFDGIFVLDFIKALPLHGAKEWAEQFYLRFPALGIIVYYPPGFAVVEAIFFALAGVNIFAARLCVISFALGACLLMFALGKRWFDRPTGFFGAMLLATCPHGFLWMNDVMLEWPALFWILAAVYAYERERERETGEAQWSLMFGATIMAAFMTKQTAGFILPVLLLHAAINPRPGARYWRRPAFLSSLAATAIVVVVYVIATRQYTALPNQLLAGSVDVMYYPLHMAEIVGWPLLPVALLGLLTFMFSADRRARGLLLIWFAAWALFCSVITAKEPRYFFFALPPLMFAAARFFIRRADQSRSQIRREGAVIDRSCERRLSLGTDLPRIVLLFAIIVAQVYLAKSKDTGRLPRYDGVIAELASRPNADVVLVDAVREGQFIFDLYQSEAAKKRIVPLRGSKVLYARASRAKWGLQELVKTPEEIVALLDKYGIRYIVVESVALKTDETDADRPVRERLRKLLRQDRRFLLVRSWPLDCGDPVWNGVELQLYEYPACPPRPTKKIKLPVPAMNREVEFELP
jgi:hypothetical protein